MRMAKVFKNGHSQAVRLPKEFQFHHKEVAIAKEGNRVILWEVSQDLSTAYYKLTSLSDEFLKEGRQDTLPQERENF